ncbi:MAG TPA: DUF3465 domain-containing protein [Thermoanaerobaculia bacterium]|nr:DUF3465 domain-containing protein [Thermoanaerobaculia bacterium]
MPNRPSSANSRRLIALLLVVAVAVVYQLLEREPKPAGAPLGPSPASTTVPRDRPAAPAPSHPSAAEPPARSVAAAFRSHARAAVVEGSGHVAKLLADDRQGSRHQRFLLRVDGGPTVLVAHNIDVAERVAPLQAGDAVRFRGEYVWNAKGGILHWTHADPDGRHEAGWIEAGGRRFQ